jgi:hypothetical protein
MGFPTKSLPHIERRPNASALTAQGRIAAVDSDTTTKFWPQTTAEKRRQPRQRAEQQKQQQERAQREEEARRAAGIDPSRPKAHDDREKLAKILALMGSDHDGEVLSAARRAERQRKRMGLTWAELLGVFDPKTFWDEIRSS